MRRSTAKSAPAKPKAATKPKTPAAKPPAEKKPPVVKTVTEEQLALGTAELSPAEQNAQNEREWEETPEAASFYDEMWRERKFMLEIRIDFETAGLYTDSIKHAYESAIKKELANHHGHILMHAEVDELS